MAIMIRSLRSLSEDAKTVVMVTHETDVVGVADIMPGMRDGVVTRHVVVP